MLSAYMRYKYPHIVDGGVASSAPFLTIAGKRPRSEFFQTVTEVYFYYFFVMLCAEVYFTMLRILNFFFKFTIIINNLNYSYCK